MSAPAVAQTAAATARRPHADRVRSSIRPPERFACRFVLLIRMVVADAIAAALCGGSMAQHVKGNRLFEGAGAPAPAASPDRFSLGRRRAPSQGLGVHFGKREPPNHLSESTGGNHVFVY